MASVTEYSDIQANAMKAVVKNDNNFHNTYYISDMPFAEMQQIDSEGSTFTTSGATVSLIVPDGTVQIDLRQSEEQKCWFFTVIIGEEEIKGIVHFNSVYNAKGLSSFMFVNETDLDDYDSITRLLPYSNFFIMEK